MYEILTLAGLAVSALSLLSLGFFAGHGAAWLQRGSEISRERERARSQGRAEGQADAFREIDETIREKGSYREAVPASCGRCGLSCHACQPSNPPGTDDQVHRAYEHGRRRGHIESVAAWNAWMREVVQE